jgi:site-specific recombinase XerC
MIIELCSQFKDLDDLMIVRDLAMIILNFSGFVRFDELSSLKYNDVTVHDHYVKLKIVHSKADQYRQGNEVLIAKYNTLACPVSNSDIMFHYLS